MSANNLYRIADVTRRERRILAYVTAANDRAAIEKFQAKVAERFPRPLSAETVMNDCPETVFQIFSGQLK